MLTALTTGLDDVLIKGKGLLGPDAVTRGDVVVKMNVDMGSVTTEEMLRELKVSTFIYIEIFTLLTKTVQIIMIGYLKPSA